MTKKCLFNVYKLGRREVWPIYHLTKFTQSLLLEIQKEQYTVWNYLQISGFDWFTLKTPQIMILFRRQSKEILKAVKENDEKLARKLETKKMEGLLQQVSITNEKEDS